MAAMWMSILLGDTIALLVLSPVIIIVDSTNLFFFPGCGCHLTVGRQRKCVHHNEWEDADEACTGYLSNVRSTVLVRLDREESWYHRSSVHPDDAHVTVRENSMDIDGTETVTLSVFRERL